MLKDKFDTLIKNMGIHAQKEYPREACGIITKDFQYVECKNISSQPLNTFIVNPLDILKYENNIWGFFHSHPGSENPLPSRRDAASTVFDEYSFIVGFGKNFYIYWYDKALQDLQYEAFKENHLKVSR